MPYSDLPDSFAHIWDEVGFDEPIDPWDLHDPYDVEEDIEYDVQLIHQEGEDHAAYLDEIDEREPAMPSQSSREHEAAYGSHINSWFDYTRRDWRRGRRWHRHPEQQRVTLRSHRIGHIQHRFAWEYLPWTRGQTAPR